MSELEQIPEHFLELIRRSKRGKFKIYMGMSAGVGKTYRMLQETRTLLKTGVDIKIGYVETHNRKETQELLEKPALVIPRRKIFYKGKELEEMDPSRPLLIFILKLWLWMNWRTRMWKVVKMKKGGRM